MERLPIIIETLTPVVFSDRSGDSVLTGTSDYFSGSSIRGAFAKEYIMGKNIKNNAEKDADFYRFFLSGELQFLPAYPMVGEDVACPLPFSLQVNKKENKENMKVLDLASRNVNREDTKGFKSLKGFGVIKNGTISTAYVNSTIELHMSRSGVEERIIGSSKDGGIYNYEAINPKQKFKGYIKGNNEILNDFIVFMKKFYNNDVNSNTMYFGRSKHTQYGKCLVKYEHIEEEKDIINVKDRLYLLAKTNFIPVRECFASAKEACCEIIEQLNKAANLNISLGENVFAQAGNEESFVTIWGLKRPTQRSLVAGTLLELVKNDATEFTNEDIIKMSKILVRGFGQRRTEGYGQFAFWQGQDNLQLAKEQTDKCDEIKDFTAVNTVVDKIIRIRIKQTLQDKARKDVLKAVNIAGNNHLFSRLENFVDGNNSTSLSEFYREVKTEFLDIPEKNFRKIKLADSNLWEILSGENQDFSYGITASSKDVNELADEVGIAIPKNNDMDLVKTYWRWYCRFARKAVASEEGVDSNE